jgi:hypothetical protein
MLPIPIFFFKRLQDGIKVFGIAGEIGIAGVNKQRFHVVLFDLMGIGLLNIVEIIVLDILLVRPIPFFDVFLQFAHG